MRENILISLAILGLTLGGCSGKDEGTAPVDGDADSDSDSDSDADSDSDTDTEADPLLAEPPPATCGEQGFEWRDAVLYFAMLDRFADGDPTNNDPTDADAESPTGLDGANARFVGGDFKGLINKLPYIQDLGATAIWISPPFDGRDDVGDGVDLKPNDQHYYSGYHGYWVSPGNITYTGTPSDPQVDPASVDRPRIDPHYADPTSRDPNAILRSFVDASHGREIAVLVDYVSNHVDIDSGLYAAHRDEWFATAPGTDRLINCAGDPLCCPADDPSCTSAPCWDIRPTDNWDEAWGTLCSFTQYLPAFNYNLPETRAWSVSDAVWWAKTYNFDGYRLDAIKHVPDDWLTEFRDAMDSAVASRPPNGDWQPPGGRFYSVGETFHYADPAYLATFVDPVEKLDGQFDFPLRARLCQAIFHGRDEQTDWLTEHQGNLRNLAEWMHLGGFEEQYTGAPLPPGGNDAIYDEDALMSTWIGNHDIPRAIHAASGQNAPSGNCFQGALLGWEENAGGDPGANGEIVQQFTPEQPTDAAAYERMALAYAILMTNPGVPLIYYGDELGLAGAGDPDNRRLMPFADGQSVTPEDPTPEQLANELALSPLTADVQLSLRDTVRRLAHIRGENRAITRGNRWVRSATEDTWVYSMGQCAEAEYASITVAINRADTEQTVEIPAGDYDNLMVDAGASDAQVAGGQVTLPPRGFLILRPRG